MRIGGSAELIRDLESVKAELEPELLGMTIEAAKLAMAVAQAATPVDTGRTRQGYFITQIGGSHRGRGVLVVLDHEYNKRGRWPLTDAKKGYSLLDVLEYGSKAHEIFPTGLAFNSSVKLAAGSGASSSLVNRSFGPGLRRLGAKTKRAAGVLVFMIGGRKIFTTRVSHRGTKAYAMMRKAQAVGQQAFVDLALDGVQRVLDRRAGKR